MVSERKWPWKYLDANFGTQERFVLVAEIELSHADNSNRTYRAAYDTAYGEWLTRNARDIEVIREKTLDATLRAFEERYSRCGWKPAAWRVDWEDGFDASKLELDWHLDENGVIVAELPAETKSGFTGTLSIRTRGSDWVMNRRSNTYDALGVHERGCATKFEAAWYAEEFYLRDKRADERAPAPRVLLPWQVEAPSARSAPKPINITLPLPEGIEPGKSVMVTIHWEATT